MAQADAIAEGLAALRAGRWADTRARLEPLADGAPPDVLEALAEACWWLCDARSSVRYREQAWVGYRKAGDAGHAAQVAIDLSIAHLVNLGNDVAAKGWLARAERVIRNGEPNPVQGWLWLMQGFTSADPNRALELITRALQFAQETTDTDLELVALSDLGLALVVAGQVEEGLALLDEAMAGTLAGDYDRLNTVVFATCSMLAACQLTGDLGRASKWCRAADEFMQRYGCPFLYATCRVHYGAVLVAAGQWPEAEEQLQAALAMADTAGAHSRVQALGQLADLRLRQGRIEEAEGLLELLDDVDSATLVTAALRLSRGEPAAAVGLLERRAQLLGDHHIEAPPTLAMLADAQIAQGDLEAARATASRLREIAQTQDRDSALGLAAVAAAHVAAADARADAAIAELEQALERYRGLELPLEAARVRLQLARHRAGPQTDLAIEEANQALSTFERLGATADLDETTAFLRSLGVTARTRPKGLAVLTEREQEVLHLVALGLSNPEIAERLYISRKTASNHVSSILSKLGLRNRAEAVAYATRSRNRDQV